MIKFTTILLTIWFIFPGCDPGWRFRATLTSKSALSNFFDIKVAARYFGGSDVEIKIKNIHSQEVIVQPLYAYAHSLPCPGKTLISTRVEIKANGISETYYLHLPDSHYVEEEKDKFDMRELWGKPGSKLSTRTPFNQESKENAKISEIFRTYLVKPGETIQINHLIPTFSCKNSTMGYPNSKGQAFEFVLPLVKEIGPLVVTIEKDTPTNANGV
jgi:hypothetical protein